MDYNRKTVVGLACPPFCCQSPWVICTSPLCRVVKRGSRPKRGGQPRHGPLRSTNRTAASYVHSRYRVPPEEKPSNPLSVTADPEHRQIAPLRRPLGKPICVSDKTPLERRNQDGGRHRQSSVQRPGARAQVGDKARAITPLGNQDKIRV